MPSVALSSVGKKSESRNVDDNGSSANFRTVDTQENLPSSIKSDR